MYTYPADHLPSIEQHFVPLPEARFVRVTDPWQHYKQDIEQEPHEHQRYDHRIPHEQTVLQMCTEMHHHGVRVVYCIN